MKLSQEEKRLMVGALSHAIAATPRHTTMRTRYVWLQKKVEAALRNSEPGRDAPPDEAHEPIGGFDPDVAYTTTQGRTLTTPHAPRFSDGT